METGRLILKVQLLDDNSMKVTLGTQHEAILALALRKAQLTIDNVLIGKEIEREQAENVIVKPDNGIVIPSAVMDRLG